MFFIENFFMRDTKIKMTPSCLTRPSGLEHVMFILKDLFQNLAPDQVRLRSGQGQVMTEVVQHAYFPNQVDERSRLTVFARIYLHPVTVYRQNNGL